MLLFPLDRLPLEIVAGFFFAGLEREVLDKHPDPGWRPTGLILLLDESELLVLESALIVLIIDDRLVVIWAFVKLWAWISTVDLPHLMRVHLGLWSTTVDWRGAAYRSLIQTRFA